MKGSLVAVCLLVLMAGACSGRSMHWEKPGSTPAMAGEDIAECRARAARQAWLDDWFYGPGFGWYPYPPRYHPFGPPLGYWSPPFREQHLAEFCMASKGYRLVPDPPKPPAASSSNYDGSGE